MYVYIYIHTYRYVCMHICIHIYIHINIYIYFIEPSIIYIWSIHFVFFPWKKPSDWLVSPPWNHQTSSVLDAAWGGFAGTWADRVPWPSKHLDSWFVTPRLTAHVWNVLSWLVVGPPLWKTWKSIGMMIIPNIWENKTWQPNHQPDLVVNNATCFKVNQGPGTSPRPRAHWWARGKYHFLTVSMKCLAWHPGFERHSAFDTHTKHIWTTIWFSQILAKYENTALSALNCNKQI